MDHKSDKNVSDHVKATSYFDDNGTISFSHVFSDFPHASLIRKFIDPCQVICTGNTSWISQLPRAYIRRYRSKQFIACHTQPREWRQSRKWLFDCSGDGRVLYDFKLWLHKNLSLRQLVTFISPLVSQSSQKNPCLGAGISVLHDL